MTTFFSLLRGINVSGQKNIKMDDLRKTFENLGFQNVKTYVQSGNVIFTGKDFDCTELEDKISGQIEEDFGFDVPVIALTMDKMRRIISNNPFLTDFSKDVSDRATTSCVG